MAAGTAMPPTAATAGRITFSGWESCPIKTSRLISSPTRRKKTAIRPSLIHSSKGFSMPNSPMASETIWRSMRPSRTSSQSTATVMCSASTSKKRRSAARLSERPKPSVPRATGGLGNQRQIELGSALT